MEFNEYIKNTLTKREIEVAEFVVLGLENKEIAEKLGISIHSVKYYVGNSFRKLNAINRMNLAYVLLKNCKNI